jgi:glycosyltransferase involved in cell wall biosynthesis
MLFDEMAAAQEFQRRVSLSARDYFERLDCFVGLYRNGLAGSRLTANARKTEIIPLGVPRPPRFVPLPPAEAMLAPRFDSNFAVGTCCRIVPDKRVEFLFDMMRELVRRVPKATLTIVGGPDGKSMDYWESLLHRVRDEKLDYIRFVGRYEDVNPFLSQFRVFVMVSDRQGCPNASLEALAMGLPVVANADGGTGEQIEDGVNGYLADTPEIMAERVELLLADPALRRALGQNARQVARTKFSMDAYRDAWRVLLDPSDEAAQLAHADMQPVATQSGMS